MSNKYDQSQRQSESREYNGQPIFNLGSQQSFPQADQRYDLQSESFQIQVEQAQIKPFDLSLEDCFPNTFHQPKPQQESSEMLMEQPLPQKQNQNSEESFYASYRKRKSYSKPFEILREQPFEIPNDSNMDDQQMNNQQLVDKNIQENQQDNQPSYLQNWNQNYQRQLSRIVQTIEDLKWQQQALFYISKQPIYSWNCEFESQTEEDLQIVQKKIIQPTRQKKNSKIMSTDQQQKAQRFKERRQAFYKQIKENKRITEEKKRSFLQCRQQAKITYKWLLQQVNKYKKNKGDEHICKVCHQKFETGRQLGGHVSRAHPKYQVEDVAKNNYQQVKMCEKRRRDNLKQRKMQIERQGAPHRQESDHEISE